MESFDREIPDQVGNSWPKSEPSAIFFFFFLDLKGKKSRVIKIYNKGC